MRINSSKGFHHSTSCTHTLYFNKINPFVFSFPSPYCYQSTALSAFLHLALLKHGGIVHVHWNGLCNQHPNCDSEHPKKLRHTPFPSSPHQGQPHSASVTRDRILLSVLELHRNGTAITCYFHVQLALTQCVLGSTHAVEAFVSRFVLQYTTGLHGRTTLCSLITMHWAVSTCLLHIKLLWFEHLYISPLGNVYFYFF